MHAAQPGRDRGPRVLVVEVQPDHWREAQTEPGGIGFRKRDTEHLVEEKPRFKIGTGGGVFDGAYAVAQVQALGAFLGDGKQALQTAAQVGGLADVGF